MNTYECTKICSRSVFLYKLNEENREHAKKKKKEKKKKLNVQKCFN